MSNTYRTVIGSTVLLLVLSSIAYPAHSGWLEDLIFSNKKYQEQIAVEAAYFWLDDVGDVFNGNKDWHQTKLTAGSLQPEKYAYDFAIIIRVKNQGSLPAWGTIEIGQKPKATNKLTLGVPSIEPDKPWSLYVITYRERLLLKEYLLDGPYLQWKKLYTIK